MSTRYTATVQDHFTNPRNLGAMADATAIGVAQNPVCGDVLKLYVRIESGQVQQVSFLAQGCPAAIAAGSMTTVLLQGRRVVDLARVTDQEVTDALGGLPPDKQHCSVLAEEAIQQLLECLGPETASREPSGGQGHSDRQEDSPPDGSNSS